MSKTQTITDKDGIEWYFMKKSDLDALIAERRKRGGSHKRLVETRAQGVVAE